MVFGFDQSDIARLSKLQLDQARVDDSLTDLVIGDYSASGCFSLVQVSYNSLTQGLSLVRLIRLTDLPTPRPVLCCALLCSVVTVMCSFASYFQTRKTLSRRCDY